MELVKITPMHRPVIWLPLLCLGLIYFIWRGPVRAFRTTGNFDFLVVHNAVQTYQDGKNPYIQEDVLDVAEAHGRRWRLHELLNARLLYGPGFLSVFAPMGWLGDGPGSTAIWLVLQLLAFGALAATCARLCGLDKPCWPVFAAASLFWAPVHTNFALGQLVERLRLAFQAEIALQMGIDLDPAVAMNQQRPRGPGTQQGGG